MIARYAVAISSLLIAVGLFFVLPWRGDSTPASQEPSAVAFADRPSDPHASSATCALLRRLTEYSKAPHQILSGQNIGHTAEDLLAAHYRSWIRLTEFREQPAPAVMAIDLGLNEIPENPSPIVKVAEAHCEAGGLVSLSMHPGNPWTESPYDDLERGSVHELLEPGHAAHTRWLATLDRVARVLKTLEQQEIVVLWRPLHEANGYWFWWCGGQNQGLTPSQYRQLWRHMHTYFTIEHDLHNLIWVYAPNAQLDDNIHPVLDFYPGDDVVDVVGIDYYGADIQEAIPSYHQLLTTGKIIALTEFGSRPADGSLDATHWLKSMDKHFPRFAYFVFWHSWPQQSVSIADQHEVDTLMHGAQLHHRREWAENVEPLDREKN